MVIFDMLALLLSKNILSIYSIAQKTRFRKMRKRGKRHQPLFSADLVRPFRGGTVFNRLLPCKHVANPLKRIYTTLAPAFFFQFYDYALKKQVSSHFVICFAALERFFNKVFHRFMAIDFFIAAARAEIYDDVIMCGNSHFTPAVFIINVVAAYFIHPVAIQAQKQSAFSPGKQIAAEILYWHIFVPFETGHR
ncbi:MAG: hypothetical protein FWE80_01055 [Oscillospiraceae bacterium]|nr:hypothetical protein [Oscillospiraceae bacterium]